MATEHATHAPWSSWAAPQPDRYGLLDQKITSQDDKIDTLSRQTQSSISDLRVDTHAQIEGVRRDFTSQLSGVSASIAGLSADLKDRDKGARTHWVPLLGTVAAMATVMIAGIGVVGSMALTPMSELIKKQDIRLDKLEDHSIGRDEYNLDLTRQQTRNLAVEAKVEAVRIKEEESEKNIAFLKGQLEERQLSYLRDVSNNFLTIAEIKIDLRTMEANLIKRPEIESALKSLRDYSDASNKAQDDRANAFSARLNGIQATVESFFPASKLIDEIWAQLRERRTSSDSGPIPVAPIAPIAPLAPVKP